MGRPTGFLEIERQDRGYDKSEIRSRNWKEFVKPLPDSENRKQAARCMDCGIRSPRGLRPVNN
jgi:glutamate synthase (NADPH/NADH) small chain